MDKTNILLLGPTGSGKTLLAKTLATLAQIPFVISDATCLTQAGYVGEDVESRNQETISKKHNKVLSTWMIKLLENHQIIKAVLLEMFQGVQQSFLKLLEGTIVNVKGKSPGDFVAIDTTNILFICGGAFAGLEQVISRRATKASIGFEAPMKSKMNGTSMSSTYLGCRAYRFNLFQSYS